MKTSIVFRPYGEKITSQEDARRLINQFSSLGSSIMAELTSELESVINREIIQTGEQLLLEYQRKVSRMQTGIFFRQQTELYYVHEPF